MANWITVRRAGHDVDINLDMCSHITRADGEIRIGTPTSTLHLNGEAAAEFEVKRSRALGVGISTAHLTAGSSGSPVHASSV